MSVGGRVDERREARISLGSAELRLGSARMLTDPRKSRDVATKMTRDKRSCLQIGGR